MDVIPGVPDSVLGEELWSEYPVPRESAHPWLSGAVMDRMRREDARLLANASPEQRRQPIQAATTQQRSANELRPVTFDDIVGQERAKNLIRRMVGVAKRRGKPMDHVLLIGRSGTGKTTFAHVIAHELGAKVYQLEAPISMDTLLELREVMEDGDVLFLDEIHQQAAGDRRGRSSNTQPEVLFSIMEDRTIPTGEGVLDFPHITFMGATTDEGALPDAFINRFPIRPVLDPYSIEDMTEIAQRNASSLGLHLDPDAAEIFATACRGVPREVNNFVRNAAMLTDFRVKKMLAMEVIVELNGVTTDGLTRDMQGMLTFLYQHGKRVTDGGRSIAYKASVQTIATAIGKSRDTKAVQLRVEPYLIEAGLVQVTGSGRMLTNAGIMRARELLTGV